MTPHPSEQKSTKKPPTLNKLMFFKTVEGKVSTPDFTTDEKVAESWLKGGEIVCWSNLNKKGLSPIIISDPLTWGKLGKEKFKLYTKYTPKESEFIVEVVESSVKSIKSDKVKPRLKKEKINNSIRSVANGFNFVEYEDKPPEKVVDEAVKSVMVCGLDHAYVDVMWNPHRDKAYVLGLSTEEPKTVEHGTKKVNRSADVLISEELSAFADTYIPPRRISTTPSRGSGIRWVAVDDTVDSPWTLP